MLTGDWKIIDCAYVLNAILNCTYFVQVAHLFLGVCRSCCSPCPFHGVLCWESSLAFKGYLVSTLKHLHLKQFSFLFFFFLVFLAFVPGFALSGAWLRFVWSYWILIWFEYGYILVTTYWNFDWDNTWTFLFRIKICIILFTRNLIMHLPWRDFPPSSLFLV